MSIQNDKLMNLQDGQVLYNDLRDRIEDTKLNATLSTPAPIVSFPDGAPYPMSLTAAIDPVQDLHGYDHPWPGGGGKNIYNNTVGSASSNGVTYTAQSDGTVRLTASSGATANSYHNMTNFVPPAGNYTYSGCPAGGSDSTYKLSLYNNTTGQTIGTGDVGSGNTFTANGTDEYRLFIRINSGYNPNGLVYKPMICLSSASNPTTYEPYSNICPITGFDGANVTVTGKNLFKFGATAVDKTTVYRPNSTQRLIVSEELNGDLRFKYNGGTWSIAYIQIEGIDGTEDYAFSFEVVSNTTSYTPYIIKDETQSTEKRLVISIGGGNRTNSVGASNYFVLTKIQVEKGTTATEYEPFSGTAYPITFPTSAGTVYGGKVTVNPDGTGELVVDTRYIELDGSSDENWGVSNTGTATWYYKTGGLFPCKQTEEQISSQYVQGTIANANTDKGFWVINAGLVRIRRETEISVTDFKSELSQNPLQIVVHIDPVTYSLTPGQVLSLLGQNNVWADTGNIQSLSYVRNTVPEMIRQDTAGQISERVTPIESSLAIVVDGDTAPKNITSGQYVYVKNHSTLATGMYHATAAIASGTSISNSNVVIDSNGIGNALLSLMFVRKTTTWGKTLTFTGSSSMTQGILLINYTPVFVWMPSTVDIDIAWLDLANSVIRCKESHTGTITFSPTSTSGTEYTITRTSGTGSFTLTKNGTDSASFTYFGF